MPTTQSVSNESLARNKSTSELPKNSPERTGNQLQKERYYRKFQAPGFAQEKGTSAPQKKGRKCIAGQTEMLLPIAGKKGKEVAAKPSAKPSARHKRAG